MKLRVTPPLRDLLLDAAKDESLPQEARASAAAGVAAGAAEWDVIKAAVEAARRRQGSHGVPSLQQVCQGSGIAFPERPKPQGKPPELQRRLDELRARLEQKEYDRMVADVTQGERQAEARRQGGLATYRQQVAFGIHVLAMMAAFYAFGHVAGMAITSNRAVHPLVGLVFMVVALVLESALFIIRTTVPPKLHQEAHRRAVDARVAKQQQRHLAERGEQLDPGQGGGGGAGAGGTGQLQGQAAALAAKPATEKKAD